MLPCTPLFINGRSVESPNTFEVKNPFSGQVVGTAVSASREECRAAIEAAGNAFAGWVKLNLNAKRDIFLKAATIAATEKYKNLIMTVLQEETESIPYWSFLNWLSAGGCFHGAAGLIGDLRGDSFPSATVPGAVVVTHRRPYGVVLAIAPWNAPISLSLRAIAIPLMCGNTVVLKTSEYSPRSQALVADILQEAGLPPGVLNIISLSREDAPSRVEEMIAHPLIRKINFTGSHRVGRLIALEAAKHLKSCVLELGGKAAVMVMDDANLLEVAKAITYGAMAHSGQICMSTERVVVQKGISAKLIEAVRDLCKDLRAGDITADPPAQISALFSETSAKNVVDLLREAKEAGAEIVLGDMSSEGTVVQPHLVTGVKPGMRIWDEECFGPVTVFATFESLDEGIELVNASDYSLVSSLWTSDMYTAQEASSRLRTGTVNINGPTIHSEHPTGLVGLGGLSGYGRFDVEHFTIKHVVVTHPQGRTLPLTS